MMKKLIYIFSFFILFSCSKDRIIELEPVVYYPEVWKKDSMVYTLSDTLGNVLTQETTFYGSSLPDTLTFRYDDNRFVRNYIIEEDNGVSLEVDSGSFVLNTDSVLLFGLNDTSRYGLSQKSDSTLIIDRNVVTNYVKTYTTYYQIINTSIEQEVRFYADIYVPIFYNDGNGKCMPCHSTGTLYPVELMPIDVAYQDLITGYNQEGEPYINLLQPQESYLYKQITGQTQPMMPTASSERGPLNSYEISTVLKWIEQGAPNN